MMYDEQHDFLPLKPGGSSVLIKGELDKSLTDRISTQFERVVVADWDSERLDWVHVNKQLTQARRIMGIELLDHLIIGSGGFVSLKKRRII